MLPPASESGLPVYYFLERKFTASLFFHLHTEMEKKYPTRFLNLKKNPAYPFIRAFPCIRDLSVPTYLEIWRHMWMLPKMIDMQ